MKRHYPEIVNKLIGCIYCVFVLAPLYFIVITAFKSPAELVLRPLSLPASLSLVNFIEAVKGAHLLQASLNSIIVTVASVTLILAMNTLLSHGLFMMLGKKLGIVIYSFIMFGMMVAGVGYVATLILFRDLHLYNTLFGVILANLAGSVPFSTYILVGFMRSVPAEYRNAAFIDGCTDVQALYYVIVPLIKPALATLAIFNFVGTWNNLFTPLLLLRNSKLFTIPLGLLNFRSTYHTDYNLVFAGVLVVSVPVLVVYFIFQNSFVKSLSGGIKG